MLSRLVRVLFCALAPSFFSFSALCLAQEFSRAPRVPLSQFKKEDRENRRVEVSIAGVKTAFCLIPAGSFKMGSPEDEKGRGDDETQHWVTISQDFWIAETETSNALFHAVMRRRRKDAKDELPVVNVSWETCREFIAKLNERNVAPDGWEFALPTEAQWEYAVRAGTATRFPWGDETGKDPNKPPKTRLDPVKSGKPNAWGLYQTNDSVSEWVRDCWALYPQERVVDPYCQEGDFRVHRGGSASPGSPVRSAQRRYCAPKNWCSALGLRLAIVRKNEAERAASVDASDAE